MAYFFGPPCIFNWMLTTACCLVVALALDLVSGWWICTRIYTTVRWHCHFPFTWSKYTSNNYITISHVHRTCPSGPNVHKFWPPNQTGCRMFSGFFDVMQQWRRHFPQPDRRRPDLSLACPHTENLLYRTNGKLSATVVNSLFELVAWSTPTLCDTLQVYTAHRLNRASIMDIVEVPRT